MEQDGKPVALALGAFSAAYAAPEIGDVPMPRVAPPGPTAEPLPGAPPFAQRLALQPRFGDPPLTGSDTDEVGGWIDLPERDRSTGPRCACSPTATTPRSGRA